LAAHVKHPLNERDDGQDAKDRQGDGDDVEEQPEDYQDHSLGPFGDTHLAIESETLGSGTRVAHQEGEDERDQSSSGDPLLAGMRGVRFDPVDPREGHEVQRVAQAIRRRVEESTEGAGCASSFSDCSVERIGGTRNDGHQPRCQETALDDQDGDTALDQEPGTGHRVRG
jgi:hypothetical protein